MLLLPGESPSGHNRERGGDERDGDPNQQGKGPGRPGGALERNPGGPGISTTREDCMTRDEIAARAQRMLWATVGTLQEVEDTLDCLVGLMPDSPEDMLEYRVPYDVMLEVE